MSRRLSQRELLALRKEMLKLKLEVQRQEFLYNSQSIRKPWTALSQFGRARLTVPSTLGAIATGLLLLGSVAPRLGKLGRWLRLGATLYPLYQAFQNTQKQTAATNSPEPSNSTPTSTQSEPQR